MNQSDFAAGKKNPPLKITILQATYISYKKILNIRCGYSGGEGNWFENIDMPTKEDARKYLDDNGARDIGLTLWI